MIQTNSGGAAKLDKHLLDLLYTVRAYERLWQIIVRILFVLELHICATRHHARQTEGLHFYKVDFY